MTRIAEYLMKEYYSKCPRAEFIPTEEVLERGLENHSEKVIVIEDGEIKGVAVYLTLTDESYNKLEETDISNVDVLKTLISENGRNIHFILLAADSLKTIRLGLRKVMKNINPKTVSWFNPNTEMLHTIMRIR